MSADDEMQRLVANRTDLISPYLLQIEFASSLRRLRSRGVITERARATAWAQLMQIEIDYRWDVQWVERAMALAELAGLSKAYDCLYLACAEANGAELYTCVARFFRAAEALYPGGIRLIGPPDRL
jgi:predicted nucleic acid-binding protein